MSCLIQHIPVPGRDDPCDLWIGYFDKLRDRFGKENARMIWLKTWEVNGHTVSCTTEPYFVDFVEKNGINVSNALTRSVAHATQMGEGWMNLGHTLLKSTKIVVPALVLIVLYFLAKSAHSLQPEQAMNMIPPARVSRLLSMNQMLAR